MTKEGTDASFAPELLGGVPEAFVHTALLAGGVGLWEWPIVSDRMALSPYLETLLGYPPGGFESTKSSFLARLMPLDRPRFELALADAIERGAECDAEFRVFDVHGACRYFVAKGRVMRDSSGAAVRLVGTMQEIPAAVVTERRMRRQQGALLALVSNERDDNLSLDDTLARITQGGGHHPRRGAHQRLVVHGGPLETRLQESVPKKPRPSDGRPGSRRQRVPRLYPRARAESRSGRLRRAERSAYPRTDRGLPRAAWHHVDARGDGAHGHRRARRRRLPRACRTNSPVGAR